MREVGRGELGMRTEMEKGPQGKREGGGNKDGWEWTETADGIYSTKSAYDVIKSRNIVNPHHTADKRRMAEVWKTPAPHKAAVTAWRLLRNRLPTCDNLEKRRVLLADEDKKCHQCNEHIETASHLFTSCTKTQEIWDEIQKWCGMCTARPPSTTMHWEMFGHCGRKKKIRKLLNMIWIGCVWMLWKKRNEKIFEGKESTVGEFIQEIKARTWGWNRTFGIVDVALNFVEWNSNELISRLV
ncbi:uncharacterized protein LOC131021125 [Salvia miltiorrhiza]|uniref:uncharacterized protein LOC131021125 n=1 Tax=Salvia miltiorrhiza TaxID=226208 RepID=UPI0025ABA235|nr:uncharacterized protein LOC131021125 [Salvia miltiorrhiza]